MSRHLLLRPLTWVVLPTALLSGLSGCVVPPGPTRTAVYVEAPMARPAPMAVPGVPPPMLMEVPPPQPYLGAVWMPGYWLWQGNWVWASGRWTAPPQPGYTWVRPNYERRGEVVIFINGHWSPPGGGFAPPPPPHFDRHPSPPPPPPPVMSRPMPVPPPPVPMQPPAGQPDPRRQAPPPPQVRPQQQPQLQPQQPGQPHDQDRGRGRRDKDKSDRDQR